ncbi:MAG: RNA 2'-phosphotransferase [Actinomycetota bacterium]|nr:RNA 2'-phosphotransferase [Actinomycetota bacterium]
MPSRDVRTSRFLALVLRHDPARIGLRLDAGGWAGIDELLAQAAAHGTALSEADLRRVVADNDKQRYVIDDERRRIRANQGHSVEVDLGLAPEPPPRRLFHGTTRHRLAAILDQGLLPMGRQHVHLSAEVATAARVGARRGPAVVLAVHSGEMAADGHEFYRSLNGVWLTAAVPARHLEPLPRTAS